MFQPGIIIPNFVGAIPSGRSGKRDFELLAISGHSEVVDYSQEVTLEHVFLNNTGCTCEATFQFPLERDCAVTRFSADINGRHIEGKIEEKEKAEEMYDDAIASGSSVFMAQQTKDDTELKINLGNVEKDVEVIVSVSFVAELKVEGEKISIAMGPKGAIPFSSTAVKTEGFVNGFSYDVHVVSSTGISVEEMKRSDYKCELNETRNEAWYLIARGMKEFKPFENLHVSLSEPHKTTVVVQKYSKEDENKFVALTLFPKLEGEVKSEMIFLIDCSGSMSGALIERAKNTLQFFLRSMQEGLIFNIICFGSYFRSMFEGSVPYNDETLADATRRVNDIRADMCGTNIYEPLKYIFDSPRVSGYPRQVFIMTDGEVVNPDQCITLVKENAHTTRVFTFGIGSGADVALCEDTAKAGNGVCVMIRETKDMREMVMKQLCYALSPGISEITVEWDDSKIVQAPSHVQPVFDGDALNIYGLVPLGVSDGKHTATILGRTEKDKDGEKSFRQVVEFDTTVLTPGTSMVKTAVKKLLDDQTDDKKIVSLSTKYGVLHKKTAFVAVGPILKDPSSGEVKLEKVGISRSTPESGGMDVVFRNVSHSYKGKEKTDKRDGKAKRSKKTERCERERGVNRKHAYGGSGRHYECGKYEEEDSMQELHRACFEQTSDHEDDEEEFEFQPVEYHYSSPVDCYCDVRPHYEIAPERSDPILDRIIKCQRANGLFTRDVHSLIGVSITDLMKYNPSGSGLNEKEEIDLWLTLLVLQYLETKQASSKSEWEVVVKKSYKILVSKLPERVLSAWREAAEKLLGM